MQMLNAVVATMGPEIQADENARLRIVRLCDELQHHPGNMGSLIWQNKLLERVLGTSIIKDGDRLRKKGKKEKRRNEAKEYKKKKKHF